MMFFRSLFLLAAASLAVAEQVIYSHSDGKVADGWTIFKNSTEEQNLTADALQLFTDAFSSFKIKGSIPVKGITSLRFDIKVNQDKLQEEARLFTTR